MPPLKKQARDAAAFIQSATILQPDYHRDIQDKDIVKIQSIVDAAKPEHFRLTPVSDAGW